jgi:Phosphotransferase enzyme family
MSLQHADARFLLPEITRTATVLGDLPEWAQGLRLAGVDVVNHAAAEPPNLAVAPAQLARAAVDTGAPMVVVEGTGARRTLLDAGYRVRRFLPLPGLDEPEVLLPLEQPAAARYALEQWRAPTTMTARARTRMARVLLDRELMPEIRPLTTIGLLRPGPPFLLAAVGRLGVLGDGGWFFTPGRSDVLSRNAFHVFPTPVATRPAWTVKFSRIPDRPEAFDRDQRGLELARLAGERVASHAPRLLGRLEMEGLHASVETTAVGQRLSSLLSGPGSRASKLRVIEAVASWLVDLARATAAPPPALDPERRRLREQVMPHWAGVDPCLVDRLPPLAAVLAHNDLHAWNLIVDQRREFTAVDWESARQHNLPLWDLLYFLADALVLLDGVTTAERRAQHALRLLRGELTASRLLFHWTDRAATTTGIPMEAVGPIATACWLHHGISHVSRWSATRQAGHDGPPELPPVERIGSPWLADPALGPSWRSWLDWRQGRER